MQPLDSIPASLATSADTERAQCCDALEKLLKLKIPAAAVTRGYSLAIVLLAAALVVMALFYFSLIAFLCWLVAWHGYETVQSAQYGPFFVFHVPMALLGGLLLIFLVKPLFLRRSSQDDRIITLEPDEHLMLFEFVSRLCAAMGAVSPARIEVDCTPNASARLEHGIGGLFKRRLILRIGLPLAAALPLDQFAGVLAHEFGHFKQRSGMLGSSLLRMLSFFFARIVFERDRLDAVLHRMRINRNTIPRVLYLILAGFVEAARGVLWMLMVIANALTCSVLRRMEHDADRNEAILAGTRGFVRTGRWLIFLDIASQRAHREIAEGLNRRCLPDDLPRLIASGSSELLEHRRSILKMLHENQTRWFDTHPSHDDRVGFVRGLRITKGLLQSEIPASHLFSDFAQLCRKTTEAFYRGAVGSMTLVDVKMIPTSQWLDQRSGKRSSFKSLRRYFQDCIIPSLPIFPDLGLSIRLAPIQKPQDAEHTLQSLRQKMLDESAPMRKALPVYAEETEALMICRSRVMLSRLFSGVPKANQMRARAEEEIQKRMIRLEGAKPPVDQFNALARERLNVAMKLLENDLPGMKSDDQKLLRDRASQFGSIAAALQANLSAAKKMTELACSIQVLCSAHDPKASYPPLVERIVEITRESSQLLTEIKFSLANQQYPFEHATTGISLGDAIVSRSPKLDDPVDTHACIGITLNNFNDASVRTMAMLADCAQQVERALGFEQLSEPAEGAVPVEEIKNQRKEQRRYWLWYSIRAFAGTVMLSVLVWMSVSPPILPSMPWDDSRGTGYRPAAFQMPYRAAMAPPHPTIYPPGALRSPNALNSNLHGPNPYDPNLNRPGQVVRRGGPPQPYDPTQQQPGQPYNPNRPGQPYTPNRPGQPYNPNRPGQPYQPPRAPGPVRPGYPNQSSPGAGGAPRPGR